MAELMGEPLMATLAPHLGKLGESYEADPMGFGAHLLGGIPIVGSGIAKNYVGHKQRERGLAMEQELGDRPEYQIPQEIQANLTDAQLMAAEGLPAEQKQLYMENMARVTAGGLRGLSDRKAGISGVEALAQNERDSARSLAAMDAEARMSNRRFLQDVRSDMAGYRDKEFQINEYDPYREDIDYARALQGGGIQNIIGGHEQANKAQADRMMQGAQMLAGGGLLG